MKHSFTMPILLAGFGGLALSGLVACDSSQSIAATPFSPSSSAARGEAPALTCPEDSRSRDFGFLVEGDVRSHVFRARSAGEQPLVIRSVSRSCGCTSADLTRVTADGSRATYELGTELAKGVLLEIRVTFDTQGKRGPTQSTVLLETNSPLEKVAFAIEADVAPAFDLSRYTVNRGKLRPGTAVDEEVVVTSDLVDRFRVELSPGAQDMPFRVELIPSALDERGWSSRWTVKLRADALERGIVSESIDLVCTRPVVGAVANDDAGPSVAARRSILITGEVLGAVSLDPPFLSFGLVDRGESSRRTCVLRFNGAVFPGPGTPVARVQGYGGEFPYAASFATQLTPREGTGDFDLELSLLGIEDDVTGPLRGFVEVATGLQDCPRVRLGFSLVVASGAPVSSRAARPPG